MCLLMIGVTSFAQNKDAESTKKEQDTVVVSFVPKGLRLGVDLVGVGKTAFDSNKTELEFSADVELHRYLINFEYGQFEILRLGANSSTYQNKGSYFRTGIDINLMRKDTDTNILFFGLRYGKATLDDQLQYLQSNTLFGDGNFDRANVDLSARWYEVTAGLKLHIASNIWLGFTNRLKFSLKMDASPSLTPHDIPGYGKATKESYWGFNYQLMYRIPFSKKK